jgi:hypothetical protein
MMLNRSTLKEGLGQEGLGQGGTWEAIEAGSNGFHERLGYF